MPADSHCLTTERTVCLINTRKQSTNGMEIAMAFRAVPSQGCGERENTSAALDIAQNPAAALPQCFFCLMWMAVIRETVLPRLQFSISQPGKWYVYHLCYWWHGTPLHITWGRPDTGMIGETESQTPAIPEGWEGGQLSPRGPAVAIPWFSGTCQLIYISAKQIVHLSSIPESELSQWMAAHRIAVRKGGSNAEVLGRQM